MQCVHVEPFEAEAITFAFPLGVSGIDIGIRVEEGVPPGFDGVITSQGANSFLVTFAGGGSACCFNSVSDAQQSYPELNLFVQPRACGQSSGAGRIPLKPESCASRGLWLALMEEHAGSARNVSKPRARGLGCPRVYV